MPAIIGFQHSPVPAEPVSSGSDYLDAMLVEGAPMPEDFIFEARLAGDDGPVWKIPFKLDRELFMNRVETIPIGKSVVIQGQTVTFNEAKLYPTRILLDVSYEESNTKQLFGLRDIHLVTEKGNVFRTGAHLTTPRIKRYSPSKAPTSPNRRNCMWKAAW